MPKAFASYDAASTTLAADRDRLAAEARIEQLLDGRVEGVEVGVEDRRPVASAHRGAS